MKYQVNFRDENSPVSNSDKIEFCERIKDFVSGLPDDAQACCCVETFPKHMKMHIVVESETAGRFESSVSSKSIRTLFLAVWNHVQPQLSRWRVGQALGRGREKISHSISESDPVKCQLCTAEKCPMVESHGRWPGKTG